MKIQSLLKTIWGEIRTINPTSIYKPAFIMGYVIACVFVLLPQIDYKEWYPDFLGKFNYYRSIDFAKHSKIEIVVDEENLSVSSTLKILNGRMNLLGIRDRHIERSGNRLALHIPSEISDRTTSLLLSLGEVSIKQRISEDSDFEGLYDSKNYIDAPLDISEITDAQLISQQDGYTSIEITLTSKSKENEWNLLSSQIQATSLGLFVDGNLYLCQVSPATDGQPKPRIIIFSQEPETRLLESHLKNPNLDSIQEYTTETVNSMYDIEIRTLLILSISLAVLSGLVFRYYTSKFTIIESGNRMLIILGLLTITKVALPSWNLPSVILLSLICFIILIFKLSSLPVLLLTLTGLGITLEQTAKYSFGYTPKLIIVASIYSLVIYLIGFFLGFYEEEN